MKFKNSKICILLALIFIYSSGLEIEENQKVVIWNDYQIVEEIIDDNQIQLILEYGGDQNYYKNPSSPISKYLTFKAFFYEDDGFRIKITDSNITRFELPETDPFPNDANSSFNALNKWYELVFKKKPFSFQVIRKSTNEVIFDTKNTNFIYSKYYLEFQTQIPTENVFGLGERAYSFKLKEGLFTIYPKDQERVMEQGKGNGQLYGQHPVYLCKEQSSQYHIVFLRSSAPMDVQITKAENGNGIIDLRVFLGEYNAEQTIIKYHKYIGKWLLSPFWSFGMHQARYGYKTLEALADVVRNYSAYEVPIEAIWGDIDYMDARQDFTIDEINYPSQKLIQLVKDYQLKFVPIIDAGIGAQDNIAHYEGVKRNIFIKSAGGNIFRGKVWPGITYFTDHFHPNATQYWKDMMQIFHEKVPFDGMWLDMNEISNFYCKGECEGAEFLVKPGTVEPIMEDLPYWPGNVPPNLKALDLNATHYNGFKEIDVHSTFGFLQTKATFDFFLENLNQTNPFILSRSTMAGSGKYGTHWTGDNVATWEFLRESISHIYNFGLFGLPQVGADICGFQDDTTPELCSRWLQLGALYPFSRNHNDVGRISQEPYALGPLVLSTGKKAISLRYSIIKYYYSLYIQKGGYGTIFKPIFFEFDKDNETLKNQVIEHQFLIGNNLLVTPILYQGIDTVEAYFPNDTWYDWISGELKKSKTDSQSYMNVTSKLPNYIPIFVRGGHIIPTQDSQNATRLKHLGNQFKLIVALSEMSNGLQNASGYLLSVQDYNNQQKLHQCVNNDCLLQIYATTQVTGTQVEIKVQFEYNGSAEIDNLQFNEIVLYGFNHNLENIKLYYFTSDSLIVKKQVRFYQNNKHSNIIEFNDLSMTPGCSFIIKAQINIEDIKKNKCINQ